MTREEAKNIIEAFLFASSRPLSITDMTAAIEEMDSKIVKELVYELKSDYEKQNKSFQIAELAGGFQLATDAYYAPWIKKLLGKEKTQRLSMPALETLAIIAYKQPITRGEIEAIRGVNVDGILESLLEKNLIKTSGRREAAGRPFVYVTREEFLVHFGLKALEDLPKLKEFTEADIDLGNKDVVIENVSAEKVSEEKREEIQDGAGETAKTD